jgi:hypothetical protein
MRRAFVREQLQGKTRYKFHVGPSAQNVAPFLARERTVSKTTFSSVRQNLNRDENWRDPSSQ